MAQLILFNKPFDVLSQFTDGCGRTTLADYIDSPNARGFYPAGRLDRDSEGLLLLTNDGRLQHRISDPQHKLTKTYWVQVEGEVTENALNTLCTGVTLKDGVTLPAKAKLLPSPPPLWPRTPPIRERLRIPTQWLELTITEGKNRQVRRMTAAVGLPTLRLVRITIGPWTLQDLDPGAFRFVEVNLPNSPNPSPRHRKSRQPSTTQRRRK